jgi:hypothetical protein
VLILVVLPVLYSIFGPGNGTDLEQGPPPNQPQDMRRETGHVA